MEFDVKALKEEWCGWEFDSIDFEMKAEPMVEFAVACGETAAWFTDPEHADFQADLWPDSIGLGSRRMFAQANVARAKSRK